MHRFGLSTTVWTLSRNVCTSDQSPTSTSVRTTLGPVGRERSRLLEGVPGRRDRRRVTVSSTRGERVFDGHPSTRGTGLFRSRLMYCRPLGLYPFVLSRPPSTLCVLTASYGSFARGGGPTRRSDPRHCSLSCTHSSPTRVCYFPTTDFSNSHKVSLVIYLYFINKNLLI